MTNGRDDVSDRMAQRFDNEGGDKKAQNEENEENNKSSMNEMNVQNVKEEWTGKTLYLPDELNSDLSKVYKQLDLELDDALNSFRKTRHFYPLLVTVGKERLESMEQDEIIERLEEIDPDLDEYRTQS